MEAGFSDICAVIIGIPQSSVEIRAPIYIICGSILVSCALLVGPRGEITRAEITLVLA